MKLLFVDESDGFRKSIRTHFVLAGVIVDSEELFSFESVITKFRKRFLNGKSLKVLRSYKAFEHSEKLELTKALCKRISRFDISFIASISGSRSSRNEKKASYVGCLSFLIERFFFYLVENNSNGIIILDTLATGHQNYIRKHIQHIIANGRKREGKYNERIFKNVFFGNDDYTNAIQLADLLCAAINSALQRYLENCEESKLMGNEDMLVCYNSFLPLFWSHFRRFNGSVSGGGIKFWK